MLPLSTLMAGSANGPQMTVGTLARPGVVLACVVACLLSSAPSRAESAELSLDEVVRTALERNLQLRTQTYAPAIAETDIRKARGIYDPLFTTLLDHRYAERQASPLSSFGVERRFFDFDVALQQLLPTGATAKASFVNIWNRDNLGLDTSNAVTPELTLSLSQPLLQGLGREVTERGITAADDAMDIALAEWNQKALDTAAEARNAYLALVKARESLATRKASLALARHVHAENQERVKAGALAAFQLQDSELGVLAREKDILDAELAVKDQADRLRLALNLPAGTVVEPSDTTWNTPPEISEEDALRTALRRRPDLAKARTALRTAEFNERISRNLALPSFALEGAVGVTGTATDWGNAFDEMRTGKYPAWSVGLNFSVPLGNTAARADVAAGRLKASQGRSQVSALEESAALEVRSALRTIETRRKQIAVAEKGVAVAETRLASYLKRGKLGLATTKDVLDAESGLTQGREFLSGSRADLQSALTDLWRNTGELLDRHGVRIDRNSIPTNTRKEKP